MQEILFSLSIIAVLFLSCLAYGSVSPLSATIFETIIGVMLAGWLGAVLYKRKITLVKSGFWIPLFFFVCVIIAQLLPLPLRMIKILSASTFRIYENFIPVGAKVSFFTLSIFRDATTTELYKGLAYAGLFFFIVNAIEKKQHIDLIVNAIIFFGLAISIFGIIQKYAYPDRVYWFDPPGSASYPFGPFFNRNNFAGYINMIIPIGLGYFLLDLPLSKRITYGVAVGVMSLALFISLSRAGILVYLATLLFLCTLLSFRTRSRQKAVFIFLWLVVVLCALLWYLDPRIVWERMATLFKKDAFIVLGHGYSWLDIARIWRDFPLFGTGLGTFGAVSSLYRNFPSQTFFSYAHNDYLQLLSETGCAGVMCMAWFFVAYFYIVLKQWFSRHDTYIVCVVLGGVASLFAMLAYSLLDFNLHIPANALLFTVLMGLVYRVSVVSVDHVRPR